MTGGLERMRRGAAAVATAEPAAPALRLAPALPQPAAWTGPAGARLPRIPGAGRAERLFTRALVRARFRHLHGPRRLFLRDHEAAAIVLGRDVAFHLPELVRHHRALGIRHFVYVDNGSTDGSTECAADLGMLTARCAASFRDHQNDIRRLAASLYVEGGWRLVVDADEMFDYPGAARVGMHALLARLNAAGATAVVAQMLDMVPDAGLTGTLDRDYAAAIAACRWYDLTGIRKFDYDDRRLKLRGLLRLNRCPLRSVALHYGGIRGALFGENCLLTKHPLFRPGAGVDAAPHPHITTGHVCADFTGLLRHYKFTGGFLGRERMRVRMNVLRHKEAELRMKVLEATPDFSFRTGGRRSDPTAEGLLAAEFLTASDAARRFLLD